MLDRIQVFGYRRFLEASAYVGRKTVAFVGPNEAGKSSALTALLFFSSDSALATSDSTRSLRDEQLDPDRPVVRLSFTLDDEQQALAKKLPIEAGALRHLTLNKLASGGKRYLFEPAPILSPKVRRNLERAWPSLRRELSQALTAQIEDEGTPFDQDDLDSVSSFLAGSDDQPRIDVWKRVNDGVRMYLDATDRQNSHVESFYTYFEWARPGVSLHKLVYEYINGEPTFVMFTEDLRSIKDEYRLSDTAIDSDPALANVLRLAGLPLDKIRLALGEPSHLRTLKDAANKRLSHFFTENWKQERVTVGIEISDEFLRIDVKDIADDSTEWFAINERSDGLRTFVALAAFLEKSNLTRPPILLIDEAEQHLHQNAQGDLIRMLQGLPAVAQVIYTTHSPACLPADLGNGVRFVEPIDKGHSRVRHDFWSLDRNEHVGFNPLLIVMGAGAAAFSSLRSALVTEGVSDMLLLPTLIKLATGEGELSYQVSPGIATASKTDMAKLDLVASRVAYLVDGDASGREWRQHLMDAGVPNGRMRSLPDGVGLEDLLDRGFYLDAVADLGGIRRSELDSLPTDVPIKSAVEALGLKPKPVGPVALAEFVLGRHESGEVSIRLSAQGRQLLKGLHRWMCTAVNR